MADKTQHGPTARLTQIHSHLSSETSRPLSEPSSSLQTESSKGKATVLILPNGDTIFSSKLHDKKSVLTLNDSPILSYHVLPHPPVALELSSVNTKFEGQTDHIPRYHVLDIQFAQDTTVADWWSGVYALFTIYWDQEHIPIIPSGTHRSVARAYFIRTGLGRTSLSSLSPLQTTSGISEVVFLSKEAFWQGAGTIGFHDRSWLRAGNEEIPGSFPSIQSFTRTEGVIAMHPLRPTKPRPGEVLYRRYCQEIGQVLELTYFDLGEISEEGVASGPEEGREVSKHLEAFHRWHNSERVNAAWGEAGSLDSHIAYLKAVLADPGVLPCMMSWDGELMGYTEIVWVKENHVAQYYPSLGVMGGVGSWDRGLHVLMGEEKFKGSKRAQTWLRGLCHYAFLAEPRTERVIGEPKESNKAIAKATFNAGFHVQGTIDFPYKRSSLIIQPRERFFKAPMP